MYSCFFLGVSYTHDGASIRDRIDNPQYYVGRKLTRMDKFDMISYKLVPGSMSLSDYREYPFPYRLYQGDKIRGYLRKTLPSTIISLGFLVSVALGYWEEYWIRALVFCLGLMVFFSIATICSRKIFWLRALIQTRVRHLNVSLSYVISKLSLGLLVSGKKIKYRYVLPLTVITYLAMVALIKYFWV